jgi:hypothetical protein
MAALDQWDNDGVCNLITCRTEFFLIYLFETLDLYSKMKLQYKPLFSKGCSTGTSHPSTIPAQRRLTSGIWCCSLGMTASPIPAISWHTQTMWPNTDKTIKFDKQAAWVYYALQLEVNDAACTQDRVLQRSGYIHPNSFLGVSRVFLHPGLLARSTLHTQMFLPPHNFQFQMLSQTTSRVTSKRTFIPKDQQVPQIPTKEDPFT